MNLREIFKFREIEMEKKVMEHHPTQLPDPTMAPQVGGQLFGVYLYYTGTRVTQWDFQNKGTSTSPARISFPSKVPLRICVPV